MSEHRKQSDDPSQGGQLKAYSMRLNEGSADEYRRRHDAIWPTLADALRQAGVLDFRIFLEPDTNTLFAIMHLRPGDRLSELRGSPLMRRWWAMMADIMETNDDLSPREWTLLPMFHLSSVD